jgi:hypothetical protein
VRFFAGDTLLGCAGNMTDKASIFFAVFNTGGKTPVHHRVHGLTETGPVKKSASPVWD